MYDDFEVVAEATNSIGKKFRAIIVTDYDPMQPDNDGGCPIFAVGPDRWGGKVRHTGYGDAYAKDAQARYEKALTYFLDYCADGIETFARWLRIFHEGSVESWYDYNSESTYVAVSTRTLAREWGVADDEPVPDAEMEEWRAYCEGDVYGIRVESLSMERIENVVSFPSGDMEDDDEDEDTRWVTEGDTETWGYYGRKWAKQAAKKEMEACL